MTMIPLYQISITPDTSGYMYLGYGFLFVAMALYLGSLYLRQRSLKRDLELMEELDKKEKN
jgi:hypothetical protein